MKDMEQFIKTTIREFLNEIKNPYYVDWVDPDENYFIRELDELLGNEMRFSKYEFFHPKNYDKLYNILPFTFKTIAEHSKGSSVNNSKKIKNILLNKEISELMEDWGEFRHVLMKNNKCRQEALSLFKMGSMVEWDEEKINDTFYMGSLNKFFPGMFKNTTSSGLIKQMKNDKNQTDPHFKGYEKNIKDFRSNRKRTLPPPFVMLLPTGGRDGNKYNLIGGHKRSTIAKQLNISPIYVWFINLQNN